MLPGKLGSHLGGMFPSDCQVLSQPLQFWKVQRGKQALGLLVTDLWGARAVAGKVSFGEEETASRKAYFAPVRWAVLLDQRGLFGSLA